jgi:hypothetical protein
MVSFSFISNDYDASTYNYDRSRYSYISISMVLVVEDIFEKKE